MTVPPRPEQIQAAFDFPRHPLAREDGERLRGVWTTAPARWLRARTAQELPGVIDAAEQAAREGAWVLGGLRYEAASALEPRLAHHAAEGALAEFAVYEQAPEPWPALRCFSGALDWSDSQPAADEAMQIERIREWIRAGDCYQVNLTTRLRPQATAPDLAQLFLALHAAQPGGFALFLREAGVASVSPELFFDWRPVPEAPDGTRSWLLAAQPMKGTAPRGRDVVDDEAAQAHLRTSPKERAENLMIVDLLRNDISRVAQVGSVRVPRLFELIALPTVWQMVSSVSAVTRASVRLLDVFRALFPCGSVTGAPKIRAMQIIRSLEPEARGWYCGALGLIQPGGVATFNVPIRTVEQGPAGLQCGIGSGITLDSEPAAELAEWRAKTRFLLRAEAPIEALETLRLEAGAFTHLELHLARLQRTAHHFGLRHRAVEVRQALAALAQQHPQGRWRVRLTLPRDGRLQLALQPLGDTPTPVPLELAHRALPTQGALAEYLQHKTTRRAHYEAFAQDKTAAAFDVLLWNEDEELTECSFGNIALQIEGRWLTPRLAAGLLPGVLREAMLARGQLQEARLLKSDLARAQGLAFFNSLRGWCPAVLISEP
ncbi:chorismate-binding protein [Mitsuaria sp. WAJ17]|uniref:chorismate-binding protein n=1 Tax=Mitsuaria sp. WAJ17 TaxID=2761452 RepID=UPI0016004C7E|nr:chorismate-binding protein [Mitsuaria sp. WAJ17]MBB2486844.1 chorismate-binding protein [Mitsuaria sp. WAJ17]